MNRRTFLARVASTFAAAAVAGTSIWKLRSKRAHGGTTSGPKPLEHQLHARTVYVTNANDSGPGSLRAALQSDCRHIEWNPAPIPTPENPFPLVSYSRSAVPLPCTGRIDYEFEESSCRILRI